MSHSENCIVYEKGPYFVLFIKSGHYETYRPQNVKMVGPRGATCSERSGIFHFRNDPDYALKRAIQNVDQMFNKFGE